MSIPLFLFLLAYFLSSVFLSNFLLSFHFLFHLFPRISFSFLMNSNDSLILSFPQIRQLNSWRKVMNPSWWWFACGICSWWRGPCPGEGAQGQWTQTCREQKADLNQEEARILGLVLVFPKQVSSLFGNVDDCPFLFCFGITLSHCPPPSSAPTFPTGLPPETRCWVNGKTTFANIKGRLFRKGRPCWGAEEACTLTRATSYLGQLGLSCLRCFPGFAKRPSAERLPCRAGGWFLPSGITTLLEIKSHCFSPPRDFLGKPGPVSKVLQKGSSFLGLHLWTLLTVNLAPLIASPFEDSQAL